MKKIEIESSGRMLEGMIFEKSSEHTLKPAVILLHGWQSGQDRMYQLAEELVEKYNCIALTFNLGGHGNSKGKIGQLSRSDYLNDVLNAYDYLLENYKVNKDDVGVIGSSFGGYLASLLSAKRALRWMVLRVPADYPNEGFDLPKIPSDESNRVSVNHWRMTERNYSETHALESLHDFTGKIMIIESELDELVPHQVIQNYVNSVEDKNNLNYCIMKGAPHSITRSPLFKKEFHGLLCSWLDNNKLL